MKRSLLYIIILMFSYQGMSQDCYGYDEHIHSNDSASEVVDIKSFFTKGKANGHIRNYFMATINEGELKDYWTNATGGSLGYYTAEWKGFHFGVKGIFTYNTFSSDLNEIDTLIGKSAKWEKELFDVTRPNEKKDLDRLEELYITYRYHNSTITYGKMDLNEGPLLLKRDGRMKPFVYKGAWLEFNEFKNQRINIGWITSVSPRGMTEWYSLNEAIGMNSNGYQPDGSKADYHDKFHTSGLGVFGYQNKVSEKLSLKVWNYYLHHAFNVSWLQGDYTTKNWYGGVQYLHQFVDDYQQKLKSTERIYQPDEQANIVSTQVGYKSSNKFLKLSAGYLHGFSTGRFIFPKELTREGFYVSQPRSWVDGFGEVDIFTARLQLKPQNKTWKGFSFDTRLQRVAVPSSTDYAQNKYGRSSYYQTTILANYSPSKKLAGVYFTFLYVVKLTEDKFNLTPKEMYYRTNLSHFNFITNIKF